MGTGSSETLVVALLGKPKFEYGDAPLRLAMAQTTLTVLAYLLLHRSAPHRRDDVAFALWPDESESEARANLRRHLHLLTRGLPQGASPWIVSDNRVVGWNARAPLRLDVEEFERLAGDPVTRERALDLYAGDLLQNLEAEWLERRRGHYRDLYSGVALEAARDALQAGAYAKAAGLAQRVVALDPWREDAVRTVVAARLGGGDRSGALVTYLDFERRLREELNAEPMPETVRVYEAIVRGDPLLPQPPQHTLPAHTPHTTLIADAPQSTPLAPLRNTLPVHISRFIGREVEVSSVAAALETCRLVTLIGAGGVGKSRLAVRVAESVRARFADEPVFVQLANVTNDKASFESKLLEAFGLAPTSESVGVVLSRTLGSRKHLVVLDNVEHLVDVAGRFLSELFARTAHLTVLATSRQPLHLQGEQIVGLKPLQLPARDAPPEASLQCEAAALFVERAKALNADVRFSPADAAHIVAVCRRLDGIPLAIELAAARTSVLAPKDIDARLSDRFALLRTRNVDALRHHQTLRATLDWSFDLLEERERRTFCRLGVFKNGWTLAAAAEVVRGQRPDNADGDGDIEALESLTRLIDQSLVIVYETEGSRRYDFLETVRAYALLRLSESEELARSMQAVTKYFARYVDEKSELAGSSQEKAAFDCIALEHDNILAVVDAAIAGGDATLAARLACALGTFWVVRGFIVAGQRRVETVLALDAHVDAVLRRQLGNVASILHYRRGEIAQAMKRATESVALSNAAAPDRVTAEALLAQARCWYASEDLAPAGLCLEKALAIFRRHDDRPGIARSLDFLGLLADLEGDAAKATSLYRQSLAIYEEYGDLQSIATVNYHLGFQAYERGEHAKSIALGTKAIEVWHEYGNLQGENWAQYNVACAEAALQQTPRATLRLLSCIVTAHRYGFVRDVGDGLERIAALTLEYAPALSARCMGYAAHLREQYGHAMLANERTNYDKDVARLAASMGDDDFRSAWRQGAAQDQEALIDALSSAVRERYST